MFNPSRDEARQFLFEAWRKQDAGELLTPLEDMAARIIALHPEYHAMLADPERHADRDFVAGAANPFLHLMMHLSVAEQLSIDQPPGIRAQFARLAHKRQSEHEALHAVMECLADTLMHAQQQGSGLDTARYLDCLTRQ